MRCSEVIETLTNYSANEIESQGFLLKTHLGNCKYCRIYLRDFFQSNSSFQEFINRNLTSLPVWQQLRLVINESELRMDQPPQMITLIDYEPIWHRFYYEFNDARRELVQDPKRFFHEFCYGDPTARQPFHTALRYTMGLCLLATFSTFGWYYSFGLWFGTTNQFDNAVKKESQLQLLTEISSFSAPKFLVYPYRLQLNNNKPVAGKSDGSNQNNQLKLIESRKQKDWLPAPTPGNDKRSVINTGKGNNQLNRQPLNVRPIGEPLISRSSTVQIAAVPVVEQSRFMDGGVSVSNPAQSIKDRRAIILSDQKNPKIVAGFSAAGVNTLNSGATVTVLSAGIEDSDDSDDADYDDDSIQINPSYHFNADSTVRLVIYGRNDLTGLSVDKSSIQLLSTKIAKLNLRGTEIISFQLSANGKIEHIRVDQSLGNEIDSEAFRIVNGIKFSPGKINGQSVSIAGVLEIRFDQLNGKYPSAKKMD